MLKNLTALFCVVVAIAGCAPDQAPETAHVVAAQQREDVSIVLDLLQDLADHYAPLVGDAAPGQLEAIGAQLGCTVYPDGVVECPDVDVVQDLLFLSAFRSPESPTRTNFDGNAHGSFVDAHYNITFDIDPDQGVVVRGGLLVRFPDRTVYIETDDVVLRLVADQDGPGVAAVFVSGHLTVRVEEPNGLETIGSAALAGASALVVLDGSLTTVNLRP